MSPANVSPLLLQLYPLLVKNRIVLVATRKTEHSIVIVTHTFVCLMWMTTCIKPLFQIKDLIAENAVLTHVLSSEYVLHFWGCEIPETRGRSGDTDTFADIRRAATSEWQRLVCLFVFVKSLLTLTVTFNWTIATSACVKTYRNVCANLWSSSCWVNEGHNYWGELK